MFVSLNFVKFVDTIIYELTSSTKLIILTLWFIHRSRCWQETNVSWRKDRHIVRRIRGHCDHQCGSGRGPRRPGIYLQVRRALRLGWPRWISNEGNCSRIGSYSTICPHVLVLCIILTASRILKFLNSWLCLKSTPKYTKSIILKKKLIFGDFQFVTGIGTFLLS